MSKITISLDETRLNLLIPLESSLLVFQIQNEHLNTFWLVDRTFWQITTLASCIPDLPPLDLTLAHEEIVRWLKIFASSASLTI
jgi:hypothetical protein